jgi:integrase
MSLRDFGNQYYAEVVTRDRKKPIQMGRYLKNDIFPFIGDTKVGDLTTEDVRSVIWRKKDHGFDAAAGDIRGLMKRMLDYAVTLGLLQTNPVLALPMKHVHKVRHRDRALTQEEVGQFLRAVYTSNVRTQLKAAFHLLLLTLVRKGELMGARWEEIDTDNAEWHVPAANMKTGKPHIVYLSAQSLELFEELRRLASGSEWVLPGRGTLKKPFAHDALNKTLQNVLEGTGIERFTIHDLRRTASTLLHEAGFNSDVIEKALAHEQKGVRGIYNRAQYADQRREMLQWWADFVDTQIDEERKVVIGRFGAQA